jgi:hypothetical protein
VVWGEKWTVHAEVEALDWSRLYPKGETTMDWTIKPYTPVDPAKLPTRVESALRYLAEAEGAIQANHWEVAAEKVRYARRLLHLHLNGEDR